MKKQLRCKDCRVLGFDRSCWRVINGRIFARMVNPGQFACKDDFVHKDEKEA